MGYYKRSVEAVLRDKLRIMGGVVLAGPRGCGKTTTALTLAASSVRFDKDPQLRQLAEINPASVISEEAPQLLDEWQLVPEIWNHLRAEIDERALPGQFILSGSATPATDITRHTGAARFARVAMRTMTLAERNPGLAAISLHDLYTGEAKQIAEKVDFTYENMAEAVVRSGWPEVLDFTWQDAQDFNREYCANLTLTKMRDRADTAHRLDRLLLSIARNQATEVRVSTIRKEVGADGTDTTDATIRSDLDALEEVFAIELQPAWSPSLRSRARLRKTAKMHFADPAMALALLRVSPERLAQDVQLFGFAFESQVVHDLRVHAELDGGKVYHYRDDNGLEVDAIIDYGHTWAAVEVKLGANEIPKAEANLIKLRDSVINTSVMGEPAYLAIITATGHAYTLESGVHVIPLAALKS